MTSSREIARLPIERPHGVLARLAFLAYGITCYALFFATFLYTVGFTLGAGVPKHINSGVVVPLPEAIIIDLALLTLFAVQHSVMARRQFKDWWMQFVPKPIERSTYVLAASFSLIFLFWQWRPVPDVIWRIADPVLDISIVALSLFGWFIVLTSTFLINHFELFGLSQVVRNMRNRSEVAPEFRTPLYYKFVRHPIYLGFMIAFWATPVMSAGHLVFAIATTAYIIIGIALEERDLIELFGDEYRRYQARVAMLLPWRRQR